MRYEIWNWGPTRSFPYGKEIIEIPRHNGFETNDEALAQVFISEKFPCVSVKKIGEREVLPSSIQSSVEEKDLTPEETRIPLSENLTPVLAGEKKMNRGTLLGLAKKAGVVLKRTMTSSEIIKKLREKQREV